MNLVKFKSDTKYRKQFFTGLSFSHPAKMHLSLQLWVIDNFTKEGETILDPMAGSGTILVACSMGRNVICVELEQKFVDMMKGNWEKIQQRGPQLGYSMGQATILQGDARNLMGILADKIITSPPYIAQISVSKQTEELFKGRQLFQNSRDPQPHSENQIGDFPYGNIDKIITSPPFAGNTGGLRSARSFKYGDDPIGERMMGGIKGGTGESPNNIDRLPYGSIDAVIKDLQISRRNGIIRYDECEGQTTSGQSKETSASDRERRETSSMANRELSGRQSGAEGSSRTSGFEPIRGSQDIEISGNASEVKGQGGRATSKLAGRVEKVLRDELGNSKTQGTQEGQPTMSDMSRADRPSASSHTLRDRKRQLIDQSDKPMSTMSREDNCSNPQSSYQDTPQALQTPVDCVISSPPYENNPGTPSLGSVNKDDWGNEGTDIVKRRGLEKGYNQSNEAQIGNLKSDSYLSAMLQVYRQCYTVLKDGGLLILVTKNFIRNKKQVDLAADTIRLCEQAGFTFQDRWYRELASQSFWRIIYHQRYPSVPPIKYEDCLIFQKLGGNRG